MCKLCCIAVEWYASTCSDCLSLTIFCPELKAFLYSVSFSDHWVNLTSCQFNINILDVFDNLPQHGFLCTLNKSDCDLATKLHQFMFISSSGFVHTCSHTCTQGRHHITHLCRWWWCGVCGRPTSGLLVVLWLRWQQENRRSLRYYTVVKREFTNCDDLLSICAAYSVCHCSELCIVVAFLLFSFVATLSSNRQQLSCYGRLEVRMDIIRTVLCLCVLFCVSFHTACMSYYCNL